MIRKTGECEVIVDIGKRGEIEVEDEVLKHLLKTLFFYMDKDVSISIKGDLRHHLWEDTGITIGMEINRIIEKGRIERFGTEIIPMDDALVLVSVDISNRAYLNFELDFEEEESGFEIGLVHEFLWGLARGIPATIHVKKLAGKNAHHVIEAAFKALGKAIKKAISFSEKTFSTKGVI